MPAPSSSGTSGSMPAGPGATGGSLASSSSFLHPASASTVRPVRAAAAGAYRLHIADPLTLAFDDVDGGSGIGNQVDPDVLAELLHFHDSELGPSILELLTDPDSTLRIGVESDSIATESSTDEQKRQRAIYYKKVAETIHPHLERFFRAEIYRRCREAAPNLCHHL